MDIKKGDIFFANLGKCSKHEQSGIRPVLIIQNNIGNMYSPTVIIAPLTSVKKKLDLPVHIYLTKDKRNNLELNSVVLLEQIKTIDKSHLYYKIGEICESDLENVNKAIKISLEL